MTDSVVVEDRVDAWVLWSRALVVAGMAVFLGVAGHVTADGLLPDLTSLVLMLGLAVPLSVPLVRRRIGALRMVSLLVGGQTLVHLWLTTTAGHRGAPPAAATRFTPSEAAQASLPTVEGRRVGSLLDAYHGTEQATSVAPSLPVGHLVADMSAHAPMMLVHVLVAVLIGLWLAHGEGALWTLLALLGRQVRCVALTTSITVPARRVLVPVVATPTDLAPRWLVAPSAQRGPPLPA